MKTINLLTCFILLSSITSCSKLDHQSETDVLIQQISSTNQTTRSSSWHWRCDNTVNDKECSFYNAGYRDVCSYCDKGYSKDFTYPMTLIESIDLNITRISGLLDADEIARREGGMIVGDFIVREAPIPWYETSPAQRVYRQVTNSLNYGSDIDYAKGYEYGWYRTVRLLFPQRTNIVHAKSEFDKFLVRDGRSMRSSKEMGIKKGAEMAIDAFDACY